MLRRQESPNLSTVPTFVARETVIPKEINEVSWSNIQIDVLEVEQAGKPECAFPNSSLKKQTPLKIEQGLTPKLQTVLQNFFRAEIKVKRVLRSKGNHDSIFT